MVQSREHSLRTLQKEQDKIFIESCIAGDQESWTNLFNIHLPPLKYKLRFWVLDAGGCDADIEDIFSDYTLRLFKDDFQNLKDFLKSGKELGAWLYNGIRWEFRAWLKADIRRKNRFEKITSWLQIPGDQDACLELLPDILDDFVATLSPSESTYISLSFDELLDDREIAERLEMSWEGVRSKRFRLRKKFKDHLQRKLVF